MRFCGLRGCGQIFWHLLISSIRSSSNLHSQLLHRYLHTSTPPTIISLASQNVCAYFCRENCSQFRHVGDTNTRTIVIPCCCDHTRDSIHRGSSFIWHIGFARIYTLVHHVKRRKARIPRIGTTSIDCSFGRRADDCGGSHGCKSGH